MFWILLAAFLVDSEPSVFSDPCTLPYVICGEYEIKENQKVYAYSSTVDQTDSNPDIGAYGTKVGPGTIANNCAAAGSRVKVNGIEYTVNDRMNSRYDCNNWDIWFPTRQEAINHGVKNLNIIILK